jgi:energy-coupling factor transporter ATP-binding protein EcfA2
MPKEVQILPKSLLEPWCDSLNITEIPRSYQVLAGLSLVGGIIGRSMHIDQLKFKIYPNISCLFIGPSGIGKDTIINQLTRAVREVDLEYRLIEAKTIEHVQGKLASMTAPAQAWLLAPELTAFLGGKDYQKSLVQDITNLLSTNDVLDASVASLPNRIIRQPTVSMLAGSTAEWLHKAMPDGSMEGGFIPRFMVMYEEYTPRHVAWIKYSLSKKEKEAAAFAHSHFMKELKRIKESIPKESHEMVPDGEARELYEEWYGSRFERYVPMIREYANRCRDHVLRVALVASVMEGNTYISGSAMQYAIDLVDYSADRVETVIRPVTKEFRIAEMIKRLLPRKPEELIRMLTKSFTREDVLRVKEVMFKAGEVAIDKEGTLQYVETKDIS